MSFHGDFLLRWNDGGQEGMTERIKRERVFVGSFLSGSCKGLHGFKQKGRRGFLRIKWLRCMHKKRET